MDQTCERLDCGWKIGSIEVALHLGGDFTFKEAEMSTNSKRESVELSEDEQRLYERLKEATDQDLRRMAQLLAVKSSKDLFGKTEYDLRDRVHELGAKALEIAADERQKKGWIRGC
jgi:hypothetical protein